MLHLMFKSRGSFLNFALRKLKMTFGLMLHLSSRWDLNCCDTVCKLNIIFYASLVAWNICNSLCLTKVKDEFCLDAPFVFFINKTWSCLKILISQPHQSFAKHAISNSIIQTCEFIASCEKRLHCTIFPFWSRIAHNESKPVFAQ